MTDQKAIENHQWTNSWNQYLATITANLIILAHGCIIGWVSPALPILSSEDAPLDSGPLTNHEISWIGSINALAAMGGTLSLGWFISIVGCKRAVLVLTIPTAAFWFLIFFGNNYYYILIARVFSGYAGGGIQTSLILFIAEIANNDIRGRLASSSMISRNIGILLGYIFGATIDYQYIPCISVALPILFVICFSILPNTPQFHLQQGHTQKAEKALRFYKGYTGNNDQEECAIHKELERMKLMVNERKTDKNIQASDFFNRHAIKGLGIGFALTTFNQLTGNFTITSYAVMIFAKTKTTLNPHISSIILAVSLLVGSIFTSYLADKLGRKILNLISLTGSAIGLFTISLYQYFNVNGYDMSAFEWVPVICLSFVIFISSAGIFALSLVCSIEYLPTKIRTYGFSIICFWINIVTFVCVKLFPILLEMINIHGCMAIFGVGSALGAIFVYFVLEETSGKSLDDVGFDEKMKQIHATSD